MEAASALAEIRLSLARFWQTLAAALCNSSECECSLVQIVTLDRTGNRTFRSPANATCETGAQQSTRVPLCDPPCRRPIHN